jgi:hypothetical protein
MSWSWSFHDSTIAPAESAVAVDATRRASRQPPVWRLLSEDVLAGRSPRKIELCPFG